MWLACCGIPLLLLSSKLHNSCRDVPPLPRGCFVTLIVLKKLWMWSEVRLRRVWVEPLSFDCSVWAAEEQNLESRTLGLRHVELLSTK